MARVLKASYHQATIHGAQTMAKQLGGTKSSTPIRDPNDNDEKLESVANAAQTAIVNANRPYYAITEGAAKAGVPNTKADGKAVGQAFNPCRS